MPRRPMLPRGRKALQKAAVEIAFIIFLFYANLLMGEFTRSHHGRSLWMALHDVVTLDNFAIAVVAAVIAYVVFEHLRQEI